jgi:ABC-type multidrug transport system fused ATPase/permease subunit
VVLSGLRTYVFAHTTSRIDVELGARLFRHLLSLPMAYFQARRVGDSVARVRELENIRAFLTGNAITVVLDVFFSGVFIAVMLFYSGWLTLVVLASLPLYLLISLLVTPLLRARLHEKFNRGAENQAFLVETVSGIDTLKAMAVEPQVTRHWDNQLAAYVSAGFRAAKFSTIAHEGVNLVSKLVTVATLWLGARLVIEGELTVGQLIAFNMLAGRVAQPIMRLAQLWTDFQQTGISVQRLGDILNSRTELAGARSPLPPFRPHRAGPGGVPLPAGRPGSAARREPDHQARRGDRRGRAAPAPAKARWPSWCSASTCRSAAVCWWMASTGAGRRLVAAPPDRRGVAGERAVQPQHPRQHRPGRPGRAAGAGHAGGETGRRARLHPGTAGGLRHHGRRTRLDPVRRPAPAHRHRPRADHESRAS